MNRFFLSKSFQSVIVIVVITLLVHSCDKTDSPFTKPASTCINSHKTIFDSVCNMAGTRPSNEHHVHYEYDAGVLVNHTIHDTTNINFTITVAEDKTVTYLNYAYSLIDSNGTVMHFANYNIPNGNHMDIYYYLQKDSFVVATSNTSYFSQVTQTDLDTLFTYW